MTFPGVDVVLRGWRCRTSVSRRGTVLYLHGVADNRSSSAAAVEWFGARGFDVVAYDSRAHGESGGDICTYGYFEKQDLRRVIDTLDSTPLVLVGTSLGAAVALQEAADDPRVRAIVAAETFSDLRTIATERAPRFFTRGVIRDAFAQAEEIGRFHIDAVSPVAAAARIAVPVLLVHGARDTETPPDHSRRVYDALGGPKRLLVVPDAGHNRSLTPEVWREIDVWLNETVPASVTSPAGAGASRLRPR